MTREQTPEMIARKIKKRRRALLTGLVASIAVILLLSQFIIWNIAPEKLTLQRLNVVNLPLHDDAEKDFPRAMIQKQPDIKMEGKSINKKFELDEEEPEDLTHESFEQPTAKKQTPAKQPQHQSEEDFLKSEAQGEALNTGYFIIFGSFETEVNAEKMERELEEKHSREFQVVMAKNGYYRVGFFTGENKSEANRSLAEHQASINPSLWMIRVN